MTDHEKMAHELLARACGDAGLLGTAKALMHDDGRPMVIARAALRAITAAYNRGRADMREEAARVDQKRLEIVGERTFGLLVNSAIRAIPVGEG